MDDPRIRALITGAAYLNSKNYLKVFRKDGFNSESIMYYNMGYSNYVVIRETISQATGGKLDVFDDPEVLNTAFYPLEYGMFSKKGLIFGADFGDCPFETSFQSNLVDYMSVVVGLKKLGPKDTVQRPSNRLSGILIGCFSDIYRPAVLSASVKSDGVNNLRKYFADSGVLISRKDATGKGNGLSATIKLLGNYPGHSHNDIGSYLISLNTKKLAGEGL